MEDEETSLMPHNHSAWYARRRVPLLLLAGACALLIIVMAGPPRSRGKAEGSLPGEPNHASVHGGPAGKAAAAGGCECSKVRVDFYGESLCPDCQHMVRDVLAPMFSNGIADLIDLRYHAFGNVRNNSDGSWSYQHGDNEGKYNRYILCAQHFHSKQTEWFPYVRCLADNMHSLDHKADECATGQSWDAAQISGCANGDKGKQLERQAAEATWALRPRHTFVPWMVVNGVAIGSDYDKLFLYICTASSANPKPDACYDLPERMRHQG
ncbi:hypothetical protein COHA_006666 [Chlorella ohadii]|uniref:Gamma-interferon-inducible lysosomal thiol reductase n=1 Tax=Chlorella ohadii TaxID=2649997 RepID=A0AAD5H0M1_9CHLO|nr:hypothetical protein COHA_006666 [Chlorella ohadii]